LRTHARSPPRPRPTQLSPDTTCSSRAPLRCSPSLPLPCRLPWWRRDADARLPRRQRVPGGLRGAAALPGQHVCASKRRECLHALPGTRRVRAWHHHAERVPGRLLLHGQWHGRDALSHRHGEQCHGPCGGERVRCLRAREILLVGGAHGADRPLRAGLLLQRRRERAAAQRLERWALQRGLRVRLWRDGARAERHDGLCVPHRLLLPLGRYCGFGLRGWHVCADNGPWGLLALSRRRLLRVRWGLG
jgi:hypothetical protein